MSELSRLTLYRRGEVRFILNYIMSNNENLRPIFKNGQYTFPDLDKLLKGISTKSILEELAGYGLLERYPVDIVLVCPECGFNEFTDRYLCPFCEGFKLERGTMIEHYDCSEVAFQKYYMKNGKLTCPKCLNVLRENGSDYRKIENIFHCIKCKKDFSVPKITHKCLRCSHSYSYDSTKLKTIFGYIFKEDFRDEVVANCKSEVPIINLLKENGYLVESPGTIKGKSGIEHIFDIIAYKQNNEKNIFAITIASSFEKVEPEVIVNHFSKAFDAKPSRSIIVAIPALNEDGKRLAKLYGIDVINANTLTEARKIFKENILSINKISF
jgi:hypothetical protein